MAEISERLLREATRLFAEKGFDGTSVQEIVSAAGVTKGAMYHYFSSKDDLLFEIYHRVLTLQMARLESFAGGPGTLEERLRGAAGDVIDTSLLHLDELKVFFHSLHLLPADRRATVRAQRRQYHDLFCSLVEEGQRSGDFRADIPADVAVQYFLSALNLIGTWYHPGGRLHSDAVGRAYVDLLFDGLRK
ncbi:MAG: TetR/AcrR family transcriptional regulator [Streptosporangiaceae bacterium]